MAAANEVAACRSGNEAPAWETPTTDVMAASSMQARPPDDAAQDVADDQGDDERDDRDHAGTPALGQKDHDERQDEPDERGVAECRDEREQLGEQRHARRLQQGQ